MARVIEEKIKLPLANIMLKKNDKLNNQGRFLVQKLKLLNFLLLIKKKINYRFR